MSRRKPEDRCDRCLLRREVCMCGLLLPLTGVATRLMLVAHARELRKPTSTGRLAALMLAGSVVHERGAPGAAPLAPLAQGSGTTLVLYPGEGAQILTPTVAAALPRPVTLVVPEGSWRQAAKTARREPALAGLPLWTLPPGPPSRYGLRRETKDAGLATLEAIARAYALLGEDLAAAALSRIFDEFVARSRRSRGQAALPGGDASATDRL